MFWIIPLIVLALLKLLIPFRMFKKIIYRCMIGIYTLAVKIDFFLLNSLLGLQFDVESLQELSKKHTYLIVSNHTSWADILVLQSVLIDGHPSSNLSLKGKSFLFPLSD